MYADGQTLQAHTTHTVADASQWASQAECRTRRNEPLFVSDYHVVQKHF
jgi:hypothetical protein